MKFYCILSFVYSQTQDTLNIQFLINIKLFSLIFYLFLKRDDKIITSPDQEAAKIECLMAQDLSFTLVFHVMHTVRSPAKWMSEASFYNSE